MTSGAQTGARSLRVLTLPDYGDANPYQRRLRAGLEERGVTVIGARAPGRDPLAIGRSWLRARRPSVVHLHWTHNYLGQRVDGSTARMRRLRGWLFIGQLHLLRRLGVRIVWTMHNLGHHELAEPDADDRAIHRRLVRLSSAVICHCENAAEAAGTMFALRPRDAQKLHVIPHGNYVGAYGPLVESGEARRALGIEPDARVLLFLGSVRRYKGVGDLIEAFRHLDGTKLRLIVAGKTSSDEDASELRALAAPDPRIELRFGFVPDDQVPTLLGAADAVVLPFRNVLTSGSAILAMSYGRAVVAPQRGCLPETLDEAGGVLYDPAGDDSLAAALRSLETADLVAMGAHNLERARRLSWSAIAAATADLYRG